METPRPEEGADAWRGYGASGGSSTISTTRGLRKTLKKIVLNLGVNKIVDLAAGDMQWSGHWLKKQIWGPPGSALQAGLNAFGYVGMDIAKSETERNARRWRDDPRVQIFSGDFTNWKYYPQNLTETVTTMDRWMEKNLGIEGRPAATSERDIEQMSEDGRSPSYSDMTRRKNLVAAERTLVFVRDALQHVSFEQGCRFLYNVWRWRRYYPYRYIIIGARYAHGNRKRIGVPGGYEVDITKPPFSLTKGLISNEFEDEIEPSLANIQKRDKRLFLYDAWQWGEPPSTESVSMPPMEFACRSRAVLPALFAN